MAMVKGQITLKDVYTLSKEVYATKKQITKTYSVKNLSVKAVNSIKLNEQTNSFDGENKAVQIDIIVEVIEQVSTNDKKLSYGVPTQYPVTFYINDINAGIDSVFKWRTGSDIMPEFVLTGSSMKERENVNNVNRVNKIYLPFFFELEGVLPLYDLLYGVNRTNQPPLKANPKMIPYFDKIALFCFENVLINLFNNKKEISKLLG